MTAPQFEYAPMKISFKKKVELSSLTPKKNRPTNLIKELGLTILCSALAAVVMVVLLILMGVLKLFGVKSLEP
jgi:hypothetical protein